MKRETIAATSGQLKYGTGFRILTLLALVAWLFFGVGWAGDLYASAHIAVAFLACVLLMIRMFLTVPLPPKIVFPQWFRITSLFSLAFQLAALAAFEVWWLVLLVSTVTLMGCLMDCRDARAEAAR